MIEKDVDSLVREMEATCAVFDRWIENEIEQVRSTSAARRQEREKCEVEITRLQIEKKKTEQSIQEAKTEEKMESKTLRERTEEQERLRDEIASMPKEIERLEKVCFLLQTKKDRLASTESGDGDSVLRYLKAYEALYGLTVQKEERKIVFRFASPEAAIVLVEDDSHNFSLQRAPPSVTSIQTALMVEFNRDRDLLRLLMSVRNCL